MSNMINYGVLKRYGWPVFEYKDSVEIEPRFLENNYLFVQSKEALYNAGGECRTELVNNVWMCICYKLGSYSGCIYTSNWREAPKLFFKLLLDANIIKQTLF